MRILALSLFVLLGSRGRCVAQSSRNTIQAGNADRTISVPLVNNKNLTYTMVLKIGTPRQEFKVMLDPAGITWVPAYYCTEGEPCFGHKMYDYTESTTQTTDWEDGVTDFGTGNVTGFAFRDTHELGGVDVGNLYFVSGTGFHEVPSFVNESFDGVFGLRLGTNSSLYEMASSGVIGKPWVGLYFSTDENVQGEALFGGANKQHYEGPLTFVDALDSAFQFRLDAYEIIGQNHVLQQSASWARPAPTESFIGGPASEINKINTLLAARKVENGKYELRCHIRPSEVTFVIGEKKIVLRPEDYVVKVYTASGTTCYSGFVEAEKRANASWQFGLVFLRRVYTVLEAPLEPSGHGRLGLAIAH
ncbi:lysosomal aspartic protease-like [Dermacentor variabilis]|uniref:lysosomal aspartic protease-like n=1 Tax=Dermacentor variabilis TaxID=34621 RepID=UPI003F5AF9AB